MVVEELAKVICDCKIEDSDFSNFFSLIDAMLQNNMVEARSGLPVRILRPKKLCFSENNREAVAWRRHSQRI